MTYILSNRIKKVLNSIIDEPQSGFIIDRHINRQITFVKFQIFWIILISGNSFILFWTFTKLFTL